MEDRCEPTEGIFGLGGKGRFIVLDTPGTPTVLVAEAEQQRPASEFEDFMKLAQPVLDSINWQ